MWRWAATGPEVLMRPASFHKRCWSITCASTSGPVLKFLLMRNHVRRAFVSGAGAPLPQLNFQRREPVFAADLPGHAQRPSTGTEPPPSRGRQLAALPERPGKEG